MLRFKLNFYWCFLMYLTRHQRDFLWLNFSPRGSHSLQGHLRGAGDETPTSGPLHHFRGWLPELGRCIATNGFAIVGCSGNRSSFRGHRHGFPEHTDDRRCRCCLVDVSRFSTDVHRIDDTDVCRTLQHRCRHAAAARSASSSTESSTHIYAGKFSAKTTINANIHPFIVLYIDMTHVIEFCLLYLKLAVFQV